MKWGRWALTALPLLVLLLTGCTGAGIGDKVAVKALYLEYDRQFEARLLVLESAPSADAGQASEEARCLAGSGDTVYEALKNAEAQENRRLFYGQNELLFLGPELARQGAFEACRFLASYSNGRPNIAVYLLDAGGAGGSVAALEQLWQDGVGFLSGVEQLESRGVYKTYLYQFGAQGGGGVIAALAAEQDTVTFSGLALYEQGLPVAFWQGAKAQLARLLAGQTDTLELALDEPQVRFELRSPRLTFEPGFSGGGMELTVGLTGNIQRLVSPSGAAHPGQDRQLEQTIDRQVCRLLEELAAETIGRKNDVFLLGSYLANLREEAARSALEAGGEELVRFDCLLRMV